MHRAGLFCPRYCGPCGPEAKPPSGNLVRLCSLFLRSNPGNLDA
jgi:hypothetical protein